MPDRNVLHDDGPQPLPDDDLTVKERLLKRYLRHLMEAHDSGDLDGNVSCGACQRYKDGLR